MRRYNKWTDNIIVEARDGTGRRLIKQVASIQDTEALIRIFKTIIDKYQLPIVLKNVEVSELFSKDEKFNW